VTGVTLGELLDELGDELAAAQRWVSMCRCDAEAASNTYRRSTSDPGSTLGSRRRLRAVRLETSIALAIALEAYDALEDLVNAARHLEIDVDPAAVAIAREVADAAVPVPPPYFDRPFRPQLRAVDEGEDPYLARPWRPPGGGLL